METMRAAMGKSALKGGGGSGPKQGKNQPFTDRRSKHRKSKEKREGKREFPALAPVGTKNNHGKQGSPGGT